MDKFKFYFWPNKSEVNFYQQYKINEMGYKPIGKHPRYAENPFVQNLLRELPVTKRMKVTQTTNSKVMQTVVNAEGDVTGHSQFLQYIEVDEEKFVKLYLSQFAAFWELGKTAIRVLGYILQVIKPKQDRLIFRMDEAKKYTQYSNEASVLSGLSQLIEKGIVARTEYDWEYFINPLIVFNGDRVTFAKSYVKKKKGNVNQIEIFDGYDLIDDAISPRKNVKGKFASVEMSKEELEKMVGDEDGWDNFTGPDEKQKPTPTGRVEISDLESIIEKTLLKLKMREIKEQAEKDLPN